MNVQMDLVGSTLRHDPDGAHYERIGLVTGVTARNKLKAASEAPGIPKQGDPHPDDPTSTVRAVSVRAAQGDPGSFLVTASYSSDSRAGSGDNLKLTDPIEIRYELRTTTETTIYDRKGEKMTTFYISGVNTSFASNRVEARTAHRVELERPGNVINITLTTRSTPTHLNRLYGGKVNSHNWGAYKRYEILCEGFEGQGDKGANLWRVTGRFYPSPLLDGSWKTQLFARNSENIIPTDARLGKGIAVYEPYKIANLAKSGFET